MGATINQLAPLSDPIAMARRAYMDGEVTANELDARLSHLIAAGWFDEPR
jgi:hypothetical protein